VTAVGIAAEACSPDLVRMLLALAPAEKLHDIVNTVDEKGMGPLYHAAFNGDADSVRLLLSAKADADVKCFTGDKQQDQQDFSPIMRTALLGHAEVASVLIEHGADLGDKVVKNDGYHPLLFASLMGQRELVQLLLRARPKGALQPDRTGLTPLMAASRNGFTATVRLLLLARGMRESIDVTDKAGVNALMYAVRNSHAAAAKVLVNAGANPRLADASGLTPFQVATNANDGMCIQALGT